MKDRGDYLDYFGLDKSYFLKINFGGSWELVLLWMIEVKEFFFIWWEDGIFYFY